MDILYGDKLNQIVYYQAELSASFFFWTANLLPFILLFESIIPHIIELIF